MATGTCKLCRQIADLVDAHIIPNSFYQPMFAESSIGLRLHADPSERYAKLRTGEYDPDLVCEDCERKFSEPERYAKQLLLDTDWDARIRDSAYGAEMVAIHDHDHRLIKQFFMGIAWKMAATDRPFFSGARLGPFEYRLRDAILRNDIGGPDDFPVLLARFSGPAKLYPEYDPKAMTLGPSRSRLDGVNCLRGYLAGFQFWLKCDARPFRGPIARFCTAPGRPLHVLIRDFGNSHELQTMHRIAHLNRPAGFQPRSPG